MTSPLRIHLLKTLYIGTGLISVGLSVFDKSCSALMSIVINSPATLSRSGGTQSHSVSWREESFRPYSGMHFNEADCSNLETLTFGDNITSIGDYVFTGLQSDVDFLGNKPTIQSNAFANSSFRYVCWLLSKYDRLV